MVLEPAFRFLELARRITTLDDTEQSHEFRAPFTPQIRGETLLGLIMQAGADQPAVKGLEQAEVLFLIFRNIHPGGYDGFAVGGRFKMFLVYPERPLSQRRVVKSSVFPELGQDLRQMRPILEPEVNPAEQRQRMAVIR